MVLYKDNKKIQDIAEYGIYYGNMPIKEVYKGSQLIYQYEPYEPSTILYYNSPASYIFELYKGYYQIALGAGWCGSWNSGVTPSPPTNWFTSRGGGAFVELIFYNPTKQQIEISAPNADNSYMKLLNEEMIVCNTQKSNSATGGTYFISDKLNIISILKASNGNNGGTGPWSAQTVTSVSTYGNWGSTANSNGGARLEYLGQTYS